MHGIDHLHGAMGDQADPDALAPFEQGAEGLAHNALDAVGRLR